MKSNVGQTACRPLYCTHLVWSEWYHRVRVDQGKGLECGWLLPCVCRIAQLLRQYSISRGMRLAWAWSPYTG